MLWNNPFLHYEYVLLSLVNKELAGQLLAKKLGRKAKQNGGKTEGGVRRGTSRLPSRTCKNEGKSREPRGKAEIEICVNLSVRAN